MNKASAIFVESEILPDRAIGVPSLEEQQDELNKKESDIYKSVNQDLDCVNEKLNENIKKIAIKNEKKVGEFIDGLGQFFDWEKEIFKNELREAINSQNIYKQEDMERLLIDNICEYEKNAFIAGSYYNALENFGEGNSWDVQRDKLFIDYEMGCMEKIGIDNKKCDTENDYINGKQTMNYKIVEKFIDRLKQYTNKEKENVKSTLLNYIKVSNIEDIKSMNSCMVGILCAGEIKRYTFSYELLNEIDSRLQNKSIRTESICPTREGIPWLGKEFDNQYLNAIDKSGRDSNVKSIKVPTEPMNNSIKNTQK